MTAPTNWTDPELEDLFREDRALHQTARLLHSSRPEPVVDPQFERRLKAQLMQAAETRPVRKGSGRANVLREPRRPFWMRLRAAHFAWGGAGLGVALTAATVVALLAGNQGPGGSTRTVVATSPVAAEHLVSPNNAILVSFNQPMDHSAVEAGLHIVPATQVTTAWQGNRLVITPVHHLAGNTPYTVTIPQTALIAASGARAAAPVQINFGTAPTPPPTVGSPLPPVMIQDPLGPAANAGVLLFAPDSGVVTNAVAATAASPTPSPSPSPSATPTATLTPSATSPTPAPVPPSPAAIPTGGSSLVELPAQSRSPLVLGPAATAAAFSPDGSQLATAVPSSSGTDVAVSRADGTNQGTLTHSAAPVVALAWTSASKLEYATAESVKSVDLNGVATTVAANTPGTIAALSPGGDFAYLAPSGGTQGRLLALDDGTVTPLAGNDQAADVAFSGDGSAVAWIDRSAAKPLLMAAPAGSAAAATVSILDPGSGLGALALNKDGGRVAYNEVLNDGTGRLVVAELPTGAPVAIATGASQVVFSPSGGALAVRIPSQQGASVALDQLPGTNASSDQVVPAAASQVLHAFLDAQVAANRSALAGLTAPGVMNPSVPQSGLSRAMLINAVQRANGTVDAVASLLVDPTSSRPTTLAAVETLTLAQRGGSYVVSVVNATPLRQLASGPHVTSMTSTEQKGTLIARVGFDSDLAAASVPGAITVQNASGNTVPVTVTYDVNTRTATLTLSPIPSGALSVVVGTALRDVNGQSPPTPFTAPLAGG